MAGERLPCPRFVVSYFDDDPADHGPGARAGVIYDAAKVGAGWYSRFPGNAFFTIRQTSEHNTRLVPGLSHVRIHYVNDCAGYTVQVFNGRVGDPDEAGDDVVWSCWDYLAELALSRTGYKVEYKTKTIASMITAEWSRDEASGKFANYGAKVQHDSLVAHVATGTIESPLNAAGTADMRTTPDFAVIDVPRLLFFYDMTELGRANTTQNVTMGFTRVAPSTFFFLKNAGSLVAGRHLSFPGTISDYRFVPGVLDVRNDLATIGLNKSGTAVEIKAEVSGGDYGYNSFGLRQGTFTIKTLAGYPNLDDPDDKYDAQKKITQRAVKEASQPSRSLRIEPRDDFMPFDGWDIEDRIRIRISNGRTGINGNFRIVGWRGVLDGTGFHQALFVALPTT